MLYCYLSELTEQIVISARDHENKWERDGEVFDFVMNVHIDGLQEQGISMSRDDFVPRLID